MAQTSPRTDSVRSRLTARWKAVPASIRKPVVVVIGLTLLGIGAVLVVLPGPFTLPFIAAALAVLATEFVWAEHAFKKGQNATKAIVGRARAVPLWVAIPACALVVGGVALTVYWWATGH